MRNSILLTKARFFKQGENAQPVSLPHTWNALDGQDGGGDYWRGRATYQFELPDPTPGKCQYIQFEGANHTAELLCNGQEVGSHAGGFSTFRFELTDFLQATGNTLDVLIDNEAQDTYPQMADFTFFGGIYRPVHFIEAEQCHVDLMRSGSDGVFVTPSSSGFTQVDVFTVGCDDSSVAVELLDVGGDVVAKGEVLAKPHTTLELEVKKPHLWHGVAEPYLYTARVVVMRDGQSMDEVVIHYGYRSFTVNADTGFILNSRLYPLRGVSRHQDRQDKGWAITNEDHREDMALIREIGANTIRLAHYQHSQYFYDLCDAKGMVVWAEIPFISQYIPGEKARGNAKSQLTELIAQNYNHPSICFWGIGNELTMGGEHEELYECLCDLNIVAKEMDPGRLTAIAQLSTVPPEHPHTTITDVQGYNIYLGWYNGETANSGPFLDAWHAKNPNRPLAVTEYGADALTYWHSAVPENHDYSEEYQAVYNEVMLQVFDERPWLYATWYWNMFEFAADTRNEGGSKGRNNKGLVSYDRKTKKDAFYIYQAYWSENPMVHICGARFVDRATGQRSVKVYTNATQVALLVNGVRIAKKTVKNHICLFEELPLAIGENQIEALADNGTNDAIILRGVEEPNADYIMPPEEIVAGNWFDDETGETMCMEYPEGYYSIRDTLEDLLLHPEGAAVMAEIQQTAAEMRPKVVNAVNGDVDSSYMLKSVMKFQIQRILKMVDISPQVIIKLNRRLNQLKK